MGNRIYGCDDCLAVCPWNKFAQTSNKSAFHAKITLRDPSLADLSQLDDESFRIVFSGSPIKRIGRDRFLRNVLISLGNSEDIQATKFVLPHLDDETPIVRGAAIWALSRLDSQRFAEEKSKRANEETDPEVQAEWAIMKR